MGKYRISKLLTAPVVFISVRIYKTGYIRMILSLVDGSSLGIRQVNSIYLPSTEITINKRKLGNCIAAKKLLI